MRSLFVDDIIGAKPSHRYFDKALYSQRHQIEIQRFGPNGNVYKKSYDWYHPHRKPIEPIERKDFPVKLLNYSHNNIKNYNPEDLSQSLMLTRKFKEKVSQKVTELSPRLNKSSILGDSGQQSLSNSLQIIKDNPYFPHRYVDKNMGQQNKWKGSMHYSETERSCINIPKESDTVAKAFNR